MEHEITSPDTPFRQGLSWTTVLSKYAPSGGSKRPAIECCKALMDRLNEIIKTYRGEAWCAAALDRIPGAKYALRIWLKHAEDPKSAGWLHVELRSKEDRLTTHFAQTWPHMDILEEELRTASAVRVALVFPVHLPQELKDHIVVIMLQDRFRRALHGVLDFIKAIVEETGRNLYDGVGLTRRFRRRARGHSTGPSESAKELQMAEMILYYSLVAIELPNDQ